MIDSILRAREARLEAIQKAFGLDRSRVIISIKANIPGPNKRISEAYLLVRLFFNRVRSMFESSNHEFIDCDDGPYVLMVALGIDAITLKKALVELEETHPLGHFIDLDVFDEPKASLSRVDLGYPLRKCYLCDRDARDCIRNQRHELKDLLKVVKSAVENHLREVTLTAINEAIVTELDLDEKFGLVTKTSSGSHEDMDYDLMIKAKDAILPFFNELFELGYRASSLNNLLEKARPIGLRAEQAMFSVTSGINCYKGIIFLIGLITISLGRVLRRNEPLSMIFTNIETIAF
ncbi:MAG: citrate lyase holo-[acyl-carrier protein] synthase, partial [Acholeplasmataceae bacterium]